MNFKKIKNESWIDPRVEIRNSFIHNKGMFAKKLIKKGEIIIVWGGEIIRQKDILSGKYRKDGIVQIEDGIFLGDLLSSDKNMDEFTNHSCDSNLWMDNEITLSARRDILPGEEITVDYALFAWVDMQNFCNCGSPLCRKIITNEDWKLNDVQKRYFGHFSPFLNKKINDNRN